MRPQIALIACLVAACGGGGGGPTGINGNNNNNSGGPPKAAAVQMRTELDAYGYAGASSFDPAAVTIARTGTVTWTNSSGNTHNVTFDQGGSPANVNDIASGSASRTFNATGTFYYHCSNHAGMSGTIVVQ